jgi:Calcineurin-like phosphoesterase/Carboxypeptidase regulatory-like domain
MLLCRTRFQFLVAFLCFLFGAGVLHAQAPADEFTIIALPDTQFYSSTYPQIFAAQTQWIASHVQDQNIKLVLGLGDIVDGGGDRTQWQNADTAVRLLDGKVPYMMAIGNHDYDKNDPASRTASTINFNTFFGPARYAGASWYKGSFPAGSNENFYGVVNINGQNYLILVLEFAPRDSSLNWAAGIISANPDKEIIVVTHMFTYSDNTRIDHCDSNSAESFGVGQDNNGEDVWWKLLQNYPNIHLVLSGHVVQGDGTGRRMDIGVHGNLVNEVLSDYQSSASGGNGYLRILKISLSLNRINVITYSPYLNSFLTDDHNQFTVPYHNPGVSTLAGSFSGIVKNAIDCSVMPGATVAAKGGSAITDSTGSYSVSAQARNSVPITATKPGWLSNARTATATPNTAAEPSPSKIWMSTAGLVTGFVCDSSGNPITGATLIFSGGKLRQTKTVVSSSNGSYYSDWIAVGAYTVTVSAAGHTSTSTSTNVNTGLTTSLNLSMQ